MGRFNSCRFIALIFLQFTTTSILAKVVDTKTYEVEGCQLSEVWADIEKKGPKDEDGDVHAGEASYDQN